MVSRRRLSELRVGYGGPYVMNANGSDATSLQKYGAIESAAARWSPVEPLLAFTTDHSDPVVGSQIAVLDVAHRKLTVLATRADTLVWSPDGRRLAFRKCPTGDPSGPDFVCEIALVDADGSGERTLAEAVKPSDVGWSPDGARIAFLADVRDDLGNDRPTLSIVSTDSPVDTVEVTRITNPATDFVFDFGSSPSGDPLAIANHHTPADVDSYGDLTLTDLSGSKPRLVSDPTWRTLDAVSWTPDGRSVIFTVDLSDDPVDHKPEVWELDVDHLTKKKFQQPEGCDRDVAPDGRIAFARPARLPVRFGFRIRTGADASGLLRTVRRRSGDRSRTPRRNKHPADGLDHQHFGWSSFKILWWLGVFGSGVE